MNNGLTPSADMLPAVSPLEPLSEIYVCEGVPWSNDYRNIRLFRSDGTAAGIADAKNNMFTYITTNFGNSWSHYTKAKAVKNNTIRVPANQSALVNCNYVVWKNANYNSDWMYGFITSTSWVNARCTDIVIEIDVFATFFSYVTLGSAYVERMMVTDDVIGNYTEPEAFPFSIGEYGNFGKKTAIRLTFKPYSIIVAASRVPQNLHGFDTVSNTINGVPVGLHFMYRELDGTSEDVTHLNGLIGEYADDPDSIVTMQTIPSFATTALNLMPEPQEEEFQVGFTYDSPWSFTPKNKKLFTYPYYFIMGEDGNGHTYEYKIEWFSGEMVGDVGKRVTFKRICSMTLTPDVLIIPASYKGNEGFPIENAMTVSGFPLVPWLTDTFKAWMAQNGGSMAISTVQNVLSIGSGIAEIVGAVASGSSGAGAPLAVAAGGMGVGSIISGVSGLASTYNTVTTRYKTTPDQTHNMGSTSTRFLSGKMVPSFNYRYVTEEAAHKIDDYFSKFGYAINRFSVPNLWNRKSWNYIKTKDVIIRGKIPEYARRIIASVFDRGFTIWHTSDIGNYTLDNSPV